jgi:Fur family transcriptional regulator, ferric uptake regulator
MVVDQKPLEPLSRPEALDASASQHSSILAECRTNGLRMTGQRKVIATVMDGADDHPDVIELHRRCLKIDPGMSLSTVYRTLKLFQDHGILARHAFRDGRSRYEPAGGEHHDHLIDLDTGKVIEFRSEEIERLQSEIAAKLGYRLIDHRLELYAVPLERTKR